MLVLHTPESLALPPRTLTRRFCVRKTPRMDTYIIHDRATPSLPSTLHYTFHHAETTVLGPENGLRGQARSHIIQGTCVLCPCTRWLHNCTTTALLRRTPVQRVTASTTLTRHFCVRETGYGGLEGLDVWVEGWTSWGGVMRTK